jgi:broad specificity phosphatase PhoE
MNAHEGGNVAVVAHGGVNRVVLCHFMGTPLEHIFRVEQDFACVNIIHFADGYPVIKLLNGGAGPLSL